MLRLAISLGVLFGLALGPAALPAAASSSALDVGSRGAPRDRGSGVWINVTQETGTSHSWPAVTRDGDGWLRLVWTNDIARSLGTLRISPDGVLGSSASLARDCSHINDPAAAYDVPEGRMLVFASLIGGDYLPLADGLYAWAVSGDLNSYPPSQTPVSGSASAASGTAMQAAITPAAVFQSWSAGGGVYVHRGLTPGGDQVVSADGYHGSLALDSRSNRLLVLLARTARGKGGLWWRTIDQTTGAGASAASRLVHSTTRYRGSSRFKMRDMPVPAAGLASRAAVVVAYPTGYPSTGTVRVWRIAPGGPTTSILADDGQDKTLVAVAADPKGRAWVVWAEPDRRRVFARRSNVGATAWGPVVTVRAPASTGGPWSLVASAQTDRLEVIAHWNIGMSDAFFYTQVFPPR